MKKFYWTDDFIKERYNITTDEELVKKINYLKKSHKLDAYIYRNGEELGKIKYEEYINKMKNKFNPYSIESVMKKYNLSYEDAKAKVNDLKRRTSGSLDRFQNKYGEEEGLKRYNEKCKKDSFRNTLEGKIDLYGEEKGKELYEIQNKRNSFSSTLEGKIEKYGLEEGTKIHNDINRRRGEGCKTESLINKFGIEKATEIINKKRVTHEYLINKFGIEKATEIINRKMKYILNYESFLMEKYNMSEIEAKIMAYRCKTRDNTSTDEFVLNRIKEIKDKKEIIKEVDSPTRASQESLLYFFPLIKWIANNYNINKNDIFLGIVGSKEYKIIYNQNFYFYDFTIPSINLIIEYDGIAFHPDRNLKEEELLKWKNPYGVSGTKALELDILKEKIAKEKGFNILIVRSDEENILDKMKKFFKDCYENCKNN